MTVASILAEKGRNVLTTTAANRIADAVSLLAKHKVGALVIIEDERIVGVISERDIVRALAATGGEALHAAVGSIMTRAVVTCTEAETVNDVMTRLTQGRFRHLPVVTDGRLVGIVSIGDVVRARIQEVEREAEEMRTYIATG